MKEPNMKTNLFKIAWICTSLMAGVYQAAALDGVLVIANEGVPVTSISADALKDIYNAKTTYWEGGQTIVIAVLADKTDDALKQVSGMDGSQFKTFWQRLAFSGRGKQPQKVDDAAALISLVASTKGAIALAPAGTELKGVKKIEIK
jgi:ABC-type phosphate transport system substrate-binding protein